MEGAFAGASTATASAPNGMASLLATVATAVEETRRLLSAVEQCILREVSTHADHRPPGERALSDRLSPNALAGLQGIDRIGQRLGDLTTLICQLADRLSEGPAPIEAAELASGMKLAEIRDLFLGTSANPDSDQEGPILF